MTRAPAPAGAAPAARVLLVDDNPDDRALVRRVLEQALGPVEVVEPTDDAALARALEAGGLDLVVTDYQIRWATGRDVLERVRARDPELPVVMFTGSGSEQLAADLLTAGLDDYVVKTPTHQQRLAAAVRSALGRSRAVRRAAALQTQLSTILERLNAGVFRCTPDGRLLDASPALLRLLGLGSAAEAAAADLRFLVPTEETAHRWHSRGAAGREYVECGHEFPRRDGGVRHLWITEFRVPDGARGEVVEGLVEDVSDRRRLEEQLRQAQKMEAIGLLAGGIAHDFNNLLTAILAGSALLARQVRDTPAIERDVADIQAAALRAADLTAQLLAFSRRQPLELRPVDPNEAVRNVRRLLDRLIGERIRIELALDPAARPVSADPAQLEQVVMNLAINARDAMPGGGTLTIATANLDVAADHAHPTELRPGAYVVLTVKDTGTGMDEATRARVFEPFFTTKAPGEGTGLGLAAVYGVVAQCGGHVTAESEPGRGSTFTVYLPVAARAAPATAEPAPSRPAARPGGGTILLVEDEPFVRRVVRRALQHAGYRVLEAEHGEAALAVAQEPGAQIDLLLTDVVMPGMSGPELAARLRVTRPGLVVLFMSGYAAHALGEYGPIAAGELLQKPFHPDALVRRVAASLERRPGPRPTAAAPRPR